jgi:response regulator RpfG family c-di-GMP phosphodiesterase
MPDLNGLDLLRKIKLVKPKVRTILISGFNLQGDDVLEKYLNDGIVNKFIQKPMAVSSLRNEVNYQLTPYLPNEQSLALIVQTDLLFQWFTIRYCYSDLKRNAANCLIGNILWNPFLDFHQFS